MATVPSSNPVEQEIQTKATHAIIAAIVGFLCCPLIDIYAIIAANQALSMIKQTGAGQHHSTLATVAKIIAIIHLVLTALVLVFYVVLIVIGVAAGVANQ